MNEELHVADAAGAGLSARGAVGEIMEPHGVFHIECRDAEGKLRWTEAFPNLVVTAGKNDWLTQYFKGAAYTAAFFVGLKGTGVAVLADTMASHASWSEVVAYSNATRPAFTLGTAAAGVISNTASPAVFTVNGTATVAGAFLTTVSTKSGTTGTLFSAADFAASRAVLSGDTLTVTYSITS